MVLKSIKESYSEVPNICGVSDFWDHLFYSLFFHDFGKAATGFQEYLNGGKIWKYRHEILSASFICSLKNIYSDFDINSIGLCIITHHKSIKSLDEYDPYFEENKETFHEKLNELKFNFNELISYFDLIPEFSRKYLGYELKIPNKIVFTDLINVFDETVVSYEIDENSSLNGVYGFFLKGFMNACDHLASSSHYKILNACVNRDLFNFESLSKTQILSSKTEGSAFLIAPTSSGKTESSLIWADNNQNHNFSKRIFYILPYTASINAMYKRLVKLVANDNLVGLSHGKDSYFIYKSLNDDSKKSVKDIQNLTKKIYRPYKILTPFQIIKYFFGIKGFEMGISELTNSLIIIDEIHAYDARTTCLLLQSLKFLKHKINCEIFIMSATIPTFLKVLFSNVLSINNIISLNGAELDSFTRHKVNIIESSVENYCNEILDDINEGKKVLIVCNTVEKSQMIFKWFKEKDISNSALLHSKFILKDRECIEKRLDKLDLLIGTQAIEVSLDIDYDVLYSEPAPFDALIQRFGRINRRGWQDNIIKPVNIFSKGSDADKYIYNQVIVSKTLKHLINVDILKESMIQKILDDIYGDFYSKNDQETFDVVKDSFNHVINNLRPFIDSSKSDFYKLFNAYEVVPSEFREAYFDKINNKEFFDAMGYCLSISVGQFNKLQMNDDVEEVKNMYFINVKYDNEIGLILSEENSTLL